MSNNTQTPCIIDDIPVYDGELIHNRFAYKYFRKQVHATGDIVAFRAPMKVEAAGMIDLEDLISSDYIYSKDAVNFCWEIPNLDAFGAVAFQRLFNTNIANILYDIIRKPIEVNGDDLMVHDKFTAKDDTTLDKGKCSVSITYVKNGAALGHTGINIEAGTKAPAFAYSTYLRDEQVEEFMRRTVNAFYHITNDIFVATTKVIA